VGLNEMVVRGCRVVEKDNEGAEEVGSWLRWEVVGGSGRVLKAVVWVFWLERSAGWTGRTNCRSLECFCGFIESSVGPEVVGGSVDLERKSMPDR
jgi:hypothetical protein